MALGDRPYRRSAKARGERGAAAIEFALVFPLFVVLTFGTISAGFAFFHDIQLTQAARDAARFGSTFPLESPLDECWNSSAGSAVTLPSSCVEAGLRQVANIAAKQTGWASAAAGSISDNGYICVAYFGGIQDMRIEHRPTGVTMSSEPCIAVNQGDPQDPQVQVVIRRDSELNAVLFSWNLRLGTTSVVPWERRETVVTPS